MLSIDSIDQNNLGLSEPFRVIRFKKVSFCQKSVFVRSKWTENGLQGFFRGIFYTKPTLKIITKSLETSILSGKVNF